MTSFILLNRNEEGTDSQLLKGKILDLSKRYVKAVALEKGGRGVGKIIPDVEGSYGKMEICCKTGGWGGVTTVEGSLLIVSNYM